MKTCHEGTQSDTASYLPNPKTFLVKSKGYKNFDKRFKIFEDFGAGEGTRTPTPCGIRS